MLAPTVFGSASGVFHVDSVHFIPTFLSIAAVRERLVLRLETMDFNSLKNTVSNLTLYDLKAGVRQLQNGKFR